MKRIVSVSKTHIHRGNHAHRKNTKKRWHIYYYDDEGNFRTEKVNWLQALYYKTQKRHRVRLICVDCERSFVGLVRSETEEVACPYCD